MSNNESAQLTAAQKREAFALVQCLDYLEFIAKGSGFNLTAHLINLAMDATNDLIRTSDGKAAPVTNRKRGGRNGAHAAVSEVRKAPADQQVHLAAVTAQSRTVQ